MLKRIQTDKAPAAIGPYSQAITQGCIIYTSGQIPIVPSTGAVVEGGIAEQTTQVLENLKAVLLEAGSNPELVIKTTCYLANMADFQTFNSIYANYFPGKPARSCVAVRELPKGVLIEVEAIAEIPAERKS